MAILIDDKTRVVCQGMTGRQGSFFSEQALTYGTPIVAGVTPGKGGTEHLSVPVFESVAQALHETDANTSAVFVPPINAASAIIEGIDAGLDLIVCVTERIPLHDMMRVKQRLRQSQTCLIGPNSFGVITPGVCKIGVMPSSNFHPGTIGVASRPSTLTYEVAEQLSKAGLGQSTCVGIGGDPIHGLSFVDALELFHADPQTTGIVLLGEIGGNEEEAAAQYLKNKKNAKPVVAYVAGRYAPAGRRMGHAGAIISGGKGSVAGKVDALTDAGAWVTPSPTTIAETMLQALKRID